MEYERITCEDVELGDEVYRVRDETHPIAVAEIREGQLSRRLLDDSQRAIRPRRATKLWRKRKVFTA